MATQYFSNIGTLEELKKEYRKLGKQLHPDNHRGSDEAFKQLQNEYEIIKKAIEQGMFRTEISIPKQKREAEQKTYTVKHWSEYGPKYFEKVTIGIIARRVKEWISLNFRELVFEIEMSKASFKIIWKEKVELSVKMKIEQMAKKIVEEYNRIDCMRCVDGWIEKTPFFRFRGFEDRIPPKQTEDMEPWEAAGYTCNWSQYYKFA